MLLTPKSAARRKVKLDRELNPELFRALADQTRLLILTCLCKCPRWCSVSEIAECCSVDLSVVSRHLAQLAGADLLESKKEGRTVYYLAKSREIAKTLRSLASAFDEQCCGAAQSGNRSAC